MRSFQLVWLPLFCSLVLLACQNPEPFPEVPEKIRAKLHILNTYAPSRVDVKIDQFGQSKKVADDLGFMQSWPATGYADLLVTPQSDSTASISELKIQLIDNSTQTELVKVPDFELKPEFPTTLCIVDSFGSPLVVRTVDDYEESVEPGMAQVRFLNLSINVLSVSLEVKNDSFKIDFFNFLNYSEFKTIPQGVKTFYFVDDFSKEIIDSIPNLEIRSRRVYNFFLADDGADPIGGYEILDQ
ncbi:MAG: hypothetical protein AAFQ87_09795 [Bacteroidota bacterium]